MLHHMPSVEAQDRLFTEVARVLRPGAVFAGADRLGSRGMQLIHYRDTLVPLDPVSLPSRLRRAGFSSVGIVSEKWFLRFRARRAAAA